MAVITMRERRVEDVLVENFRVERDARLSIGNYMGSDMNNVRIMCMCEMSAYCLAV